jgi:hypothetical protein
MQTEEREIMKGTEILWAYRDDERLAEIGGCLIQLQRWGMNTWCMRIDGEMMDETFSSEGAAIAAAEALA